MSMATTLPEDWAWSSFRHYLTGIEGVVGIESEWTGRRRERIGPTFRVKIVPTLSPKDGDKSLSLSEVEGVGTPLS